MPTLCLHRWDGSLRVSDKLLISMAPWVGIELPRIYLILLVDRSVRQARYPHLYPLDTCAVVRLKEIL